MERKKGYILLEVQAAAALIALTALALTAALLGAVRVFQTAEAVTRGRLLAASHLEKAAAGQVGTVLREGELESTLTPLAGDGYCLWQAEVIGPGLNKPLRMVGGP